MDYSEKDILQNGGMNGTDVTAGMYVWSRPKN